MCLPTEYAVLTDDEGDLPLPTALFFMGWKLFSWAAVKRGRLDAGLLFKEPVAGFDSVVARVVQCFWCFKWRLSLVLVQMLERVISISGPA